MNKAEVFEQLQLDERNPGVFAGRWLEGTDGELPVHNPATDEVLGYVGQASAEEYDQVVESSLKAFASWQMLPAPKRGEFVRQIGHALREHKEALGALVSLEMGKIRAEGEGEVQEMIDICDFAVGLSRQLYGLTMASERPLHRMYEQWHPLGPVGVITAFNFPVAVWSWNSTLAAVCGDTVIWKPSSETPLTAVAVTKIAASVMEGTGFEAVFNLVVGKGSVVGDRIDPGRSRGCHVGGGAVWSLHPRAWRQQRHHRDGRRQPRTGGPRRALCRRRHRWPTVHLAATTHRPSCHRRQGCRPLGRRL